MHWLLQHKIANNKLGELNLSDIHFKNIVDESRHIKKWLEKNNTVFSSLPLYPPILRWSYEEQSKLLGRLPSLSAQEVEEEGNLEFQFVNDQDFRTFINYAMTMRWCINVSEPY